MVLRCLPETVPADLAAVASAHAFSGKYVLAIAARPLQPGEVDVSTRDEAALADRGEGPESVLGCAPVVGVGSVCSFAIE